MLRKVVALLVLSIITPFAGCTLLSHEAPSEDIDKAATLFFQRLDKSDFDGIYNDASKPLRQNKPRATVVENLKQLTTQGKTQSFDRISMTFQGEGKDRMVLPVYRITFEQGKGELTLTFQDESGEWKLFGFSFKPR